MANKDSEIDSVFSVLVAKGYTVRFRIVSCRQKDADWIKMSTVDFLSGFRKCGWGFFD